MPEDKKKLEEINLTHGDNSEGLTIGGDVAYLIDTQRKLNDIWRLR